MKSEEKERGTNRVRLCLNIPNVKRKKYLKKKDHCKMNNTRNIVLITSILFLPDIKTVGLYEANISVNTLLSCKMTVLMKALITRISYLPNQRMKTGFY